MYGISISLVSILMIIVALSADILGGANVFPFFTKEYAFRNIVFVAFFFILFIESFIIVQRAKVRDEGKNVIKFQVSSIAGNLQETLYLLLLAAPFIAVIKVFVLTNWSEVLRPLYVFVFFIFSFRLSVFFVAHFDRWFEKFMRISIILSFGIPVLAFCIWEYTNVPAVALSYLSPCWFLLEILRGRMLPILPFVIIWIVPTVLIFMIYMIKSRKQETVAEATK